MAAKRNPFSTYDRNYQSCLQTSLNTFIHIHPLWMIIVMHEVYFDIKFNVFLGRGRGIATEIFYNISYSGIRIVKCLELILKYK